MATITRFEDLEVWQLARRQAQEIFALINTDPFYKDFELKNQINASSGSVMDNIAEGFDRSGNKEFNNFLLIAKGSNAEVRSQLYRANDRNYVKQEKFDQLKAENEILGNKIMAFSKYLQTTELKGQRYK